jgi:hypothetical protein
VGGEQANRSAQIGEFALTVFVRSTPAAFAEAAVVKGERGQPAFT